MNERIRKERSIEKIEHACILIAAISGTIFLSTFLTTFLLTIVRQSG